MAQSLLSTTPSVASESARPFSQSSFWDTAIPVEAKADPNSAAFVTNIANQVATHYGTASFNTGAYSAPVYTVPVDQPMVAMKYWNCQNKTWIDPEFVQILSAVPIPANAVPASGTDGEMVVRQPGTNKVWDLWKVQRRTDGWYACWGGLIENASQTNGVFPKNFGTTASGLALLGGMMRIEELQSGVINHALDLGLVDIQKSSFSWPAKRTDGQSADPTAPLEGQRFRLDPSLDVESLALSPTAKIVARAAQKYGFVVRDRSGAVSLYAENGAPTKAATGVDPYAAILSGKPTYSVMANFPWNGLQAMPMDYGKPMAPDTLATTTALQPVSSTTSSTTTAPTVTTSTSTTLAIPASAPVTTIPVTTITPIPAITTWTTSSTTSTNLGESVVQSVYSARPAPTTYVNIKTQIFNSAGRMISQKALKVQLRDGSQVYVSITLPLSTPSGEYTVRQVVFNDNFSKTLLNKQTSTFRR